MNATYDNVIVKVHYEETKNNLIVPDSAKQYDGDFWGEVISIGPTNTLGLNVGDKVLFERHEGKEIEEEGQKYMVLRQTYIQARIA